MPITHGKTIIWYIIAKPYPLPSALAIYCSLKADRLIRERKIHSNIEIRVYVNKTVLHQSEMEFVNGFFHIQLICFLFIVCVTRATRFNSEAA